MNIKHLLFISISLLLLIDLAYSDPMDSNLPNPYIRSYPFESAVIHYRGKSEYGHSITSEGTEVVYITSGWLAKVKEMTVPGPDGTTRNLKTLRIFTPEYVYTIDLIKKTGLKIDNQKKYGISAYNGLSVEEKKAFHDRMKKRGIISLDLIGLGKKLGTDTVLGRKCDVYQSGKKLSQEEPLGSMQSGDISFYTKSWIWKEAKIPFRAISMGPGWSSELRAIKIEENVKIPNSRFMVPSDIKLTYDKEKSEAEKREILARFELYKTGKPMIIRRKVKKETVIPK